MNTTAHMLSQQIQAQADQFDAIYESADPFEELFEVPLEITTTRQVTVVLSTGGPHVEMVGELDTDGRLTHAEINGYWAGERHHQDIPEGSPLWQAMEVYAEAVTAPA